MLSCLLAFSVFTISVHAKDLIRYTDAGVASKVEFRDITDKAVKELHDHVDKQVLKTFAKTFNDGYTVMRLREDYDHAASDDPGLWGRFHETLLFWRVFASLPFALFA